MTELLETPDILEFDESEGGFLDGVTAVVKSARYGKLEYKNKLGEEVAPPKIALKVVYVTAKNNKELRPIDFSTGIDWDNGGKVTISSDGTKLLVKAGTKLPKRSDAYFFRESSINAGVQEEVARKNDTSVFEGLTFVLASEKNKRAGDQAKPKPYPHHLVAGGSGGVDVSKGPVLSTPAQAGADLSPGTITKITEALTSVVSTTGQPVKFMALFKDGHLNRYFDSISADATTRTEISGAIFRSKSTLGQILAGSGLKYVGEEISFG